MQARRRAARAPPRRGLLAGKVTIHEEPGRPVVWLYRALREPHYQLEDVAASFPFDDGNWRRWAEQPEDWVWGLVPAWSSGRAPGLFWEFRWPTKRIPFSVPAISPKR